jgi:uncharacterized membrane protein
LIPIEQIHPLVVHFPIVFVLTLAFVDLVFVVRGMPVHDHSTTGNLSTAVATLAAISAAVAFVFGDLALDVALANGTPLVVLERHEELGHVTAAVVFGWGLLRTLVWWRRVDLKRTLSLIIVFLELGIAALIVTTAYFGGQLVYEHGIGISEALLTN